VVQGPAPQTRGKSRRQRGESPAQLAKGDIENETTNEVDEAREDTPQVEGDLSPVITDSVAARRVTGAGKRKASVVDDIESPRDRKRVRDDSEPVEEDEAGKSVLLCGSLGTPPDYVVDTGASSHAPRGRRRTEEQKRFQNVIGMLHSQISQHRNGNIFHNPIKKSEAPDYHDIVKRPIDLKTIKVKVKDGIITNSLEYQRDILLMFANAMMYNRPGSDVHAMAEDVRIFYFYWGLRQSHFGR
jgi:bromodomain-containing protein 8